jgi:hypothetical protein
MVGSVKANIVDCATPGSPSMSRAISEQFIYDLKQGRLASLTRKIQNDDTLMLALRGKSINIYYRGGNILRLKEWSDGYTSFFDKNYAAEREIPRLPISVRTEDDCQKWVQSFPALKEIMNEFLAHHHKAEREFQQLVAWENNRSPIANETEYFFTDIEFADSEIGARADMIGLKWKASERKDGLRCTPVLVEMKYGIGALQGRAGIVKHIDDLNDILGKPGRQVAIKEMIADQFQQLDQLGLFCFTRSKRFGGIKVEGKPEVILLLANHNPRSKKLLQVLTSLEEPEDYHLKFFVASFAGYAMHSASMLSLAEFRQYLERMTK